MKIDKIIENIGELITMEGPKRAWTKKDIDQNFSRIKNGCILLSEDKIVGAGPESIMDKYNIRKNAERIDVKGKLVTPGLVDAHVHLIFYGWRENELALTLEGAEYLEILESGGGILSTVKSTRKASEKQLYDFAYRSLDLMLEHGTTSSEAKSGYGLTAEDEIKSLRVIKKLNKDHKVDLVATFLGAHAIPEEYRNNPDDYVNLIINNMLPKIKEEDLAEFCDVFCEEGVFTVEQSRNILNTAKKLGFKLKIHGDELVSTGGGELAAEVGATTAEHLLRISDQGIKDLGKEGVIAELLPGTPFYLMLENYADARKMLENNVPVGLATDLNPGTSATESLQIVMNLACYMMKMTPEEIITAVTRNGAYGINRGSSIGSLENGKLADIVIWNADNIEFLIYHFGTNLVDKVYKRGKLVVDNGKKIR